MKRLVFTALISCLSPCPSIVHAGTFSCPNAKVSAETTENNNVEGKKIYTFVARAECDVTVNKADMNKLREAYQKSLIMSRREISDETQKVSYIPMIIEGLLVNQNDSYLNLPGSQLLVEKKFHTNHGFMIMKFDTHIVSDTKSLVIFADTTTDQRRFLRRDGNTDLTYQVKEQHIVKVTGANALKISFMKEARIIRPKIAIFEAPFTGAITRDMRGEISAIAEEISRFVTKTL